MEPIAIACFVIGAIIILPLIWLIANYNRFVSVRQQMKETWSGVDVELKRRHDLIPNLVNTVKGYAEHEREIFEKISALRSQAMSVSDPGAKAHVEGELARVLHRLVAVAESYPQLKADA